MRAISILAQQSSQEENQSRIESERRPGYLLIKAY